MLPPHENGSPTHFPDAEAQAAAQAQAGAPETYYIGDTDIPVPEGPEGKAGDRMTTASTAATETGAHLALPKQDPLAVSRTSFFNDANFEAARRPSFVERAAARTQRTAAEMSTQPADGLTRLNATGEAHERSPGHSLRDTSVEDSVPRHTRPNKATRSAFGAAAEAPHVRTPPSEDWVAAPLAPGTESPRRTTQLRASGYPLLYSESALAVFASTEDVDDALRPRTPTPLATPAGQSFGGGLWSLLTCCTGGGGDARSKDVPASREEEFLP